MTFYVSSFTLNLQSLMTNKLVFHFIDLFDSLIRSVQDPTLKRKLYHEFDMTQIRMGTGFSRNQIQAQYLSHFIILMSLPHH